MTINWWTMALQTINFLVLVWLLQRFLYKPVLAIIAKRKKLVEQAFVDADAARKAADAEQHQLRQARSELAVDRQELLKQTHAELEAERTRAMEEARREAARMLDAARQQISSERNAALKELRTEIGNLAVEIAGRLLQQLSEQSAAPAEFNNLFLAQLTDRLQNLTEEERQALSRDLGNGAGALEVATADVLTAEQQQRWREGLEGILGSLPQLEFTVDAGLLGGSELRFPHSVLSLAWSEQLQQGKRALLEDENIH